jgi:hypothetical protein
VTIPAIIEGGIHVALDNLSSIAARASLLAFTAFAFTACDRGASIASDLSGVAASDQCAATVGSKVNAPWSRTQKKFPGTVTEVYGKLALIDFDDGDQGWALCANVDVTALGGAAAGAAATELVLGANVRAPWSRAGRLYAGRVSQLYGKLALIDFDDGDQGWADVTQIIPPGAPTSVPPLDACAVTAGQAVMAPWSRQKAMYPGTVSEVHGKLAKIGFDDGDVGWALCHEVRAK